MPESQEQLNSNTSSPQMRGGMRRGDENLLYQLLPFNSPPHLRRGGLEGLRIALVHDFLLYYGGAEKVLEALSEMFPEAPIYTLLYDKEKMRGKFKGKEIRTSFLQKFPRFLRKRYKYLLPFMPTAPETFNLRDFDLVISSSGAWSKGIVTKLNTIHIAYIHSPMRFVWDYREEYLRQFSNFKFQISNFILRPVLSYLRIWDRLAAERPDYLIANSRYTQSGIKKYYRRDSAVIYPPAINFTSSPQMRGGNEGGELKNSINQPLTLNSSTNLGRGGLKNYFLIVSRLSPYKKVDLAIEAFNKLELPLVVIGEGTQEKYLRKIAGKNIKILGWQNEEKLADYYQNARAFIFPACDDFGITAIEAMSYGLPVIALKKGGVREPMIEGKTGEFFDAQTPEVLADAVRRFMEKEKQYNREEIKKRAEKFLKERFKKELRNYIDRIIKNFND
jgi:glycosyltransferase involved in cell wall biosynthesis